MSPRPSARSLCRTVPHRRGPATKIDEPNTRSSAEVSRQTYRRMASRRSNAESDSESGTPCVVHQEIAVIAGRRVAAGLNIDAEPVPHNSVPPGQCAALAVVRVDRSPTVASRRLPRARGNYRSSAASADRRELVEAEVTRKQVWPTVQSNAMEVRFTNESREQSKSPPVIAAVSNAAGPAAGRPVLRNGVQYHTGPDAEEPPEEQSAARVRQTRKCSAGRAVTSVTGGRRARARRRPPRVTGEVVQPGVIGDSRRVAGRSFQPSASRHR